MAFYKEKYRQLSQELLNKQVTLVAVSKTKPLEDLQAAYDAGVRNFGENYVQELCEKQPLLPADINWHFIGHLQTNKVKYIAPFVHLIHGVDSEKLLLEINKQGQKLNKVIECLLQVHIASEETKFGMNAEELQHAIDLLPALPFVKVRGLMGLASLSDNPKLIQSEFSFLNHLFHQYHFDTLSMGMSGDYEMAIKEGSNMVRIGSLIFGSR
jgi:pyridoxal phosphate enzyme (YggS family)